VRSPGEIPALLEFIELSMGREAAHAAMRFTGQIQTAAQ